MGNRFVCLRTHSWYSLLEGASSPEALLERASSCGYGALALTDTNNLYGAVSFAGAAQRVGVRAILGCRLQHDGQRATALIAEPAGYRSLCVLLSRLHLQGGAKLPQLLADHNEGLHLLVDDPFLLKPALADRCRSRLWVEVVRPGPPEAREKALLEVGFRLGLRPVASLAARFAAPNGAGPFRLLTAIRQGVALDQLPPRLPVRAQHHLADPDEVSQRFRDLPDAVANTERLAEACRSDVLPRGRVLPPCQVPAGQDPDTYLRLTCEREFPRRQWQDEPGARRRLEHELKVIAATDFSGHFLAVGDLAREARAQGWPFALRGSAGGSLVCHLLGITDADPLRHGLRFERFLHPGRESPPDIDLDFAAQVRSKAWNWLLKRFGADHVARVGMLTTFRARSAFRAAAAAHGATKEQLRPLLDSLGPELEELEAGGEGADRLALAPPAWPLEPEVWPRVVADARQLVGRPHEWTTHPSGVVLTAAPVEQVLPLERGAGGVRLAQFGKGEVERVGLVKLDLLTNRALSVLAEARQQVQSLSPPDAVLPCDDADPAVLRLLRQGDTLGIGQLETPSMRRLLRQAQPRGLQDLVQALAVTRPGAAAGGNREAYLRRRQGLEAVAYDHPCLEQHLRETWGLFLFEDDCLAAIEALTGLPAPEADAIRKGLTDAGGAEAAAARFLGACERAGVPCPAGEAVCSRLRRFASYAFCKAHAVSYGLICWQQAQLKARHPLPFWVAVLNNHEHGYPRRVYVEGAKRAGLAVHPPCVNRSQANFSQEVHGIRTGLAAIRSLGAAAVQTLLEERDKGGPFTSLGDVRKRVSLPNQDLALLVRAGAFDFTGRGRELLLREAEVVRYGRLPAWWPGRDEDEPEPFPLDDLPCAYAPVPQWRYEWELLGYVCGPPLLHLLRGSLPADLVDSRGLPTLAGRVVRLAGLVAARKEAGEGEPARCLTLEDEWGLVEVITQPGGDLAQAGPVVVVEGKVEDRHGVPVVVASRLERPLPGGGAASPGTAPAASGLHDLAGVVNI